MERLEHGQKQFMFEDSIVDAFYQPMPVVK